MGSSINQTDHLVELTGRAVSLMVVRYFRTEASVTMFRATLAREFVRPTAAQSLTANERYRRIIFPFKVDGTKILDEVNPIWSNPGFILPAVASLAWLFDAILSPSRHATFRPMVECSDNELYGKRLVAIEPSDHFNEARFNIMVSGAAKAYLGEPDFMTLSRWALANLSIEDSVPTLDRMVRDAG